MAVAAAQAGQDELALDRFRALMGHSPADAPWVPIVRDRITATANRLGLDPEEVMPEPQPPAPEAAGGLAGTGRPPAAGGLPGPTEEQMSAAQDMDPEAQQEMIRGMVEGLAAGWRTDPDDLDGWQRLGRSYAVLGGTGQGGGGVRAGGGAGAGGSRHPGRMGRRPAGRPRPRRAGGPFRHLRRGDGAALRPRPGQPAGALVPRRQGDAGQRPRRGPRLLGGACWPNCPRTARNIP